MTKHVLTRFAAAAAGALMVSLAPKLAQDAKIDVVPLLADVTKKNFKDKLAGLKTGIADLTKGKLAQDADMSDVVQMLDAMNDMEVAEGADIDPSSGLPMAAEAMDDDLGAKIGELLKGKVPDELLAAVMKLCGGGTMDADMPAKVPGADEDKDDDKKDKDMVTKPAMDAALKALEERVKKKSADNWVAIRDAERAVRPYVGDLAMAHDSADGVYRTALTAMGVKVEGVHPSAFPAILAAQPVPGKKASTTTPTVAMDAASEADFAKRFPGAAKIKHSI